jgi:trehalose 6-phosphate phosphatase
LAEQVKAVIKDYPKLKLTQGRKVIRLDRSIHAALTDCLCPCLIIAVLVKKLSKTAGTLVHQVLEIRPSIKWDKGKALEFLLESLGTCITTNNRRDDPRGHHPLPFSLAVFM